MKIWSVTQKDIADFVGISPNAIKVIKSGDIKGSKETQRKITLFYMQRVIETMDIFKDLLLKDNYPTPSGNNA